MNFREAIDQQEHNFVILGKFNAQIFHPSWLASEKLISKKEAEESTVKINSKGISVFKTAWFDVEVTDDRFKVWTNQYAYFEMLRDLTMAIFAILGNTPVKAVGINFGTHLRMHSSIELEAFFNKLTPQTFWNGFFEKPEFEKIVMRNLRSGAMHRLSIEKSVTSENGIYIDSNDHFDELGGTPLWDDKLGNSYVKASNIVDLISSNYLESVQRTNSAMSEIWKLK